MRACRCGAAAGIGIHGRTAAEIEHVSPGLRDGHFALIGRGAGVKLACFVVGQEWSASSFTGCASGKVSVHPVLRSRVAPVDDGDAAGALSLENTKTRDS